MSSFSRRIVAILWGSSARLTDVAPIQFTVLSEATDWGLVGADFRAAIAETVPVEVLTLPQPGEDHTDELVEA